MGKLGKLGTGWSSHADASGPKPLTDKEQRVLAVMPMEYTSIPRIAELSGLMSIDCRYSRDTGHVCLNLFRKGYAEYERRPGSEYWLKGRRFYRRIKHG